MGKSILIASGKGGTGRSSFAINMGATLALEGKRICLFDFNMGLRNLDIYLGLENYVIFDLGDIMSGMCRVEKTLIKDDRFPCLYLMESPQNKLINGLTPGHVKALVNQLKTMFDYVIIDGPSGIGKDAEFAAAAADSAVIITTADYQSIRSADASDRRLASLGIKSRCFIINMMYPAASGNDDIPGLEYISRAMSIPLAGIIPYDINIHIGNNSGCPVVLAKDSYIASNFRDIVKRLLG